jgi:hypothetical protein
MELHQKLIKSLNMAIRVSYRDSLPNSEIKAIMQR